MGKRSSFERRQADFYPTPPGSGGAADPVPSSRQRPDFYRACSGAGDLVRHLEAFGLRCVYAGDIPVRGRMRSNSTITAARDLVITNRRSLAGHASHTTAS